MTFTPEARKDLSGSAGLRDAPEAGPGRPVDLVEREAVESSSRDYIRRRRTLAEAEPVHG